MYHVAVVSRWRGLRKHKPTETCPPPFPPAQTATRLTWRQEGCVTRVAPSQLNRCCLLMLMLLLLLLLMQGAPPHRQHLPC